jgi:hypothetical protein
MLCLQGQELWSKHGHHGAAGAYRPANTPPRYAVTPALDRNPVHSRLLRS